MSLCDRRSILGLGVLVSLAACGFQPVYRSGGAPATLIGEIFLPEAVDPISFAYRERLRRRFGDAGDAAKYVLENSTALSETGIAITQASDVTRYRLTGETRWKLVDQMSGAVVLADTSSAFTGFDATSSAYASRAARQAAEMRLAQELAELTINAISAYLSENDVS